MAPLADVRALGRVEAVALLLRRVEGGAKLPPREEAVRGTRAPGELPRAVVEALGRHEGLLVPREHGAGALDEGDVAGLLAKGVVSGHGVVTGGVAVFAQKRRDDKPRSSGVTRPGWNLEPGGGSAEAFKAAFGIRLPQVVGA